MALEELLRKWQVEPDVDVLREGLEPLVKALMGLDVEKKTGVRRYQPPQLLTGGGFAPRTPLGGC